VDKKKSETKKQLQLFANVFTCLMFPAVFEYGYSHYYHMNRIKKLRKNEKFCNHDNKFYSFLSFHQGSFFNHNLSDMRNGHYKTSMYILGGSMFALFVYVY
jgi:hypothetical protein